MTKASRSYTKRGDQCALFMGDDMKNNMAAKSGTELATLTASTAKRNGRYLQFRFKDEIPYLDRIEFR